MTEMETRPAAKKDLSVSMLVANLYALITGVLPAILLLVLFDFLWGEARLRQGLNAFLGNLFLFLVAFVGGVILHELLHAVGWMVLGGLPRQALKVGFQWRTLTPYAHSRVIMPARAYRWGTLLPGLLLGLLPAFVAILLGNGALLAFGALFTLAAGGDFLILWLLRRVPGENLVEDHPTRAGCYVLAPGSPRQEK